MHYIAVVAVIIVVTENEVLPFIESLTTLETVYTYIHTCILISLL